MSNIFIQKGIEKVCFVMERGGWSYSIPQISNVNSSVEVIQYSNNYYCQQYSNYMFEDPHGGNMR